MPSITILKGPVARFPFSLRSFLPYSFIYAPTAPRILDLFHSVFVIIDSNPVSTSPGFSPSPLPLPFPRKSGHCSGTTARTALFPGSLSSHISHFIGRPESGSLKKSREGHEARQKSHSVYSLPSSTYLSRPGAFRLGIFPGVNRQIKHL